MVFHGDLARFVTIDVQKHYKRYKNRHRNVKINQ